MKAQSIAYPINLLLFCRLLLFFQNTASYGSSNNEFMVKVYLCMTTVYIVSLYANITKLEHAVITAD